MVAKKYGFIEASPRSLKFTDDETLIIIVASPTSPTAPQHPNAATGHSKTNSASANQSYAIVSYHHSYISPLSSRLCLLVPLYYLTS